MKNIIFISHATPEDNDFSIWLASRLQLLGYNIWIDKKGLLGGEKFWEEIDQIIRYKATKFLLVYSQNICFNKCPGRFKDGIYKEYSLAESVSKQEGYLKDFIILLNIDGSASNLFIGADRLNQIPFYENWADGLKQLVKKLEKDNIKTSQDNINPGFAYWYESEYTVKNGIVPKKELYYSNWWPIHNLPQFFYIYQFDTEYEAQALYNRGSSYPAGKIANVLSSFDPEIPLDIEEEGQKLTLKPKSIHEIKVSDVLLGFEGGDFPTHKDAGNNFKRLLSRTFHQIMKNRGMFWYEMANKKLAYFYTYANLKPPKSSFEYLLRKRNKEKTKTLIGKYLSLGKWHFAISSKPILSPYLGFYLKAHIIFTEDGFKVWEDKDKIHAHRRAKGRRFFNEEWRDMFFAFLHGLKNHEGKIELPLNKQFTLLMETWTKLYWADFGYYEPKDKKRQDIISQYQYEEIEESEEEDKITD